VKRSETPGSQHKRTAEPAERAIAVAIAKTSFVMIRLSAAPRASDIFESRFLGFRCAPPQALRFRLLRRLNCEITLSCFRLQSMSHRHACRASVAWFTLRSFI
jgi:hypothetical protein